MENQPQQFNAAAEKRFRSYMQLRMWSALLGVLTVLFAILCSQGFLATGRLALEISLIALPLLVSTLAVYASKFSVSGDWSIARAGADEMLILALGAAGAIVAVLGYELWVALTVSLTITFIGWQELRRFDLAARNYSKIHLELGTIADRWESLVDEASSKLVQAELASMRDALQEAVDENAERFGMASSIKAVEEEFLGIDAGRDTPPDVLNAMISRYPKTTDAKG